MAGRGVGAWWLAEYFIRSQDAWFPVTKVGDTQGRILPLTEAIEFAQEDRDWSASLGFPTVVRVRHVKTGTKIILP